MNINPYIAFIADAGLPITKPLLDAEKSAKLRGRITGFFLLAAGAGLAVIRRH